MRIWRSATGALLALALAFPVAAADLNGYAIAGQCTFAEQSPITLLPSDEIELRVTSYYDVASDALESDRVIESRSPAFLWARETKFHCGKAIGYLKGGFLDEDSVQKCDCFYGRMLRFR